MCDRIETVPLQVPIPADLSYTGCARWELKPIDSCIASLVQALNDAGILTRSSCCGHGGIGEILLQDGRTLRVRGPGEGMREGSGG